MRDYELNSDEVARLSLLRRDGVLLVRLTVDQAGRPEVYGRVLGSQPSRRQLDVLLDFFTRQLADSIQDHLNPPANG